MPEFDTDESMKDIDYDDIMSDSDGSEQPHDIEDGDSRATPAGSEASSQRISPQNRRETRRKETKCKL